VLQYENQKDVKALHRPDKHSKQVPCVTKILTLHSEPEILKLLQIILERAGYEALSTASSRTALTILQTEKIDLFIQNLMRPDINGCEFYSIMQDHAELRNIPVLIISAINPLTYPHICAHVITNLYPHHYLLMPFSPNALLMTLKEILAKAASLETKP
jgi:DNA-binding response OmpR family regulator